MSWQTVARGGIFRMHRGVIPRPTGVTSMQNQLRRLCLSTSSAQARPILQAVLPIRSLVQSKSFATASTDAKTTKKPNAKKPKVKKTKKPLTEEQLARKKLKEDRAQIKQLKLTALQPPKKLPYSFYTLALQAKLPELKGQYPTMGEAFKQAPALIKTIEGYEKQQIEAKAEENLAANAAAFEAWVRSHTPLEIRQANVARRHLFRVFNKTKYTQIRDDRLIKKPTTAYMAYTTERLKSSEFRDKSGKESLMAIANEWRGVSESDKQRYQKVADADMTRYLREHEEVYGFSPRNLEKKHKSAEV